MENTQLLSLIYALPNSVEFKLLLNMLFDPLHLTYQPKALPQFPITACNQGISRHAATKTGLSARKTPQTEQNACL